MDTQLNSHNQPKPSFFKIFSSAHQLLFQTSSKRLYQTSTSHLLFRVQSYRLLTSLKQYFLLSQLSKEMLDHIRDTLTQQCESQENKLLDSNNIKAEVYALYGNYFSYGKFSSNELTQLKNLINFFEPTHVLFQISNNILQYYKLQIKLQYHDDQISQIIEWWRKKHYQSEEVTRETDDIVSENEEADSNASMTDEDSLSEESEIIDEEKLTKLEIRKAQAYQFHIVTILNKLVESDLPWQVMIHDDKDILKFIHYEEGKQY